MIRIELILCGPLSVNTYVAWQEGKDTCILIDPADSEKVKDFLRENGLKPERILLTHGHFDHVMGVKALQEEFGASVCIHEAEQDWIGEKEDNLGRSFRVKVPECTPDVCLKDGDVIEAAGFTIHVIGTPGHSPGGVCYRIEEEKVIFSGDTLFCRSVGRSDFPGSSTKDLYYSIKDKLFTLEGDYRVFPGHSRVTTLEDERQNNPCMKPGGRFSLKW